MNEMFILLLLLMMINLILMFKVIPIFGFPIALFTIYFAGMYFVFDTTIPANPVTSVFVVFMAVAQMYLSFKFVRGKR